MTTATKYAKQAIHFSMEPEDDKTASCPDGLHEEERYMPGFKHRVRRTDSDADVSRYERSFELAQKNQGKAFTWRHYHKLLQQTWPHYSHDPVQLDASSIIKTPKSQSYRKKSHHIIFSKSYTTDTEDFYTPLGNFHKKSPQKSAASKDHCNKSSQTSRMEEDFHKISFQRSTEAEDTYKEILKRISASEGARKKIYKKNSRSVDFRGVDTVDFSKKFSSKNSVPEGDHRKAFKRHTVSEDSFQKTSQRSIMDFSKKPLLQNSVLEDSHRKEFPRNNVFVDSCKKTSRRKSVDFTKESLLKSSIHEDTYRKEFPTYNTPEDFSKKIFQRSITTVDGIRKSLPRNSLLGDTTGRTFSRNTVSEDFINETCQRNIKSEDLHNKPSTKGKGLKNSIKKTSEKSISSEDSCKKISHRNKLGSKLNFKKDLDDDIESISSIDALNFITPMPKMITDISRYITPLEPPPWLKKSTRLSSPIDSPMKSPKGSKWRKKLSFLKDFDIESISSVDSALYVTAISKMKPDSEISSYVSNSDSEPWRVRSILQRSASSVDCNTAHQDSPKGKPVRNLWKRRSFFQKKVGFDTESISSIESTILPLTPRVKRLYKKISAVTDESCREDSPIKSKKRNKDQKKCLQPLKDEPIYAKVNKKCKKSSGNGITNGKLPKKCSQTFDEGTTYLKSFTPIKIRARSMTSSTPKDFAKGDDEFVNELQYKVKLSLWRRVKTFVKKEFKINKNRFSSRKYNEIET